MNKHSFQHILNERLSKTVRVLGNKAADYAKDGDRLHNFRVAARIGNESMAKALEGMMRKHLVSVYDLIDKDEREVIPADLIDEKIGDLINYLILLEAVLLEEKAVKP